MSLNMKSALAALLMVLTPGCKDSQERSFNPTPGAMLHGAFVGTYSITHDYSSPDPRLEEGSVRLTIEDGEYTLTSAKRYVPPGGCGSVRVGEVLSFSDECVHTAEFDWTLIIRGDFTYTLRGSDIVLERYDETFDRFHRFDLRREVDLRRGPE